MVYEGGYFPRLAGGQKTYQQALQPTLSILTS